MISRVSPDVRRILVASRIAAMTRGLQDGQHTLQQAHAIAVNPYDRAAIGLLESEMLAADLQLEEALRVFEHRVEPFLPQMDHRVAAVIADNKAQVLIHSFKGFGDFYHLVDARRILGAELRDHASRLEAASNAAAGRHFDALPAYWQQLRSSYELQNWRARQVAEADFCEECIQLGWLDAAAYHAMLAGSKKTVERSAEALLASRSPRHIADALNRLLSTSALREHALQTTRVLAKCADAIPDELLGSVAALLSRHASFQPTGWHDVGLFENTWDAIRGIAHRLNATAIRELTDAGLKHPILDGGGPPRKHLVDGLNALTAHANAEELPRIADVALRLVTDRRSDTDYTESLNWVCHVADRGGDDIKSRVRSTLFPPGAEVRDTLLIQVGPILGWQPQKPEIFSDGAIRTAEAIRKQVQRLEPGEEPANIGGYGTSISTGPGGRIVVHINGALHLVQALAAHRAMIDEAALSSLISAMLDMIAERDNLISNRAAMTLALERFLDRFPTDLQQRAVEVLGPLAAGRITEPSQGQSHAEATNPLNRFKLGGGDPIDLRGAALKVLCRLDRDHPTVCPALHDNILLSAVTSEDPEVRRYGAFAAAQGGNLTPIEKATVALAGLDPNPRVASLAMHAMIMSEGVKNLEPITWQIVIRAIESATKSSHGGYRATAAEMLKRLPQPPTELKPRFEMARQALLNDALFSVRRPLLE